MVSRDEFDAMLDRLACELPEELYKGLNGGIIVLDGARLHPRTLTPGKMTAGGLYIMGEYRYDRAMGRYIVIYYGSFMRLYPNLTPAQLEPHLRSTLRHEFRHHLEAMAGLTTLADEDREKIDRWLGST